MRKMNFFDGVYHYAQVDKRTARAVFRSGLDIVFCPANLRPFTAWNNQVAINIKDCDGYTFDEILNQFEYYNCRDNETGKYTRFYMPVNDINNVVTGSRFYESYNYDFMND